MKPDTNWGELMQTPRAKSARRFLSSVWAFLVIIGGVLWGGVSMGYWLGVNDERIRSQLEIDRLQAAYGYRLDRLAGKTAEAADVAGKAAEVAQEAAGVVDKMVTANANKGARPGAAASAAQAASSR